MGGRERTVEVGGSAALVLELDGVLAEGVVTVVSANRRGLTLTIKSARAKVLGVTGVKGRVVDLGVVGTVVDVDTTGGGEGSTEGEAVSSVRRV